jgi:CDP-diacylglycerol---serine O-phosphatidyltransferase
LKIKQNIPNFITCCNLLCGCLAIVCAFEGNLVWSAYLVGLAAVLDFFDGFAARMLGVSSPIGKDLDSLADMVTFGVVPGVVVYKMALNTEEASISFDYVPNQMYWLYYFCFIITIFSAIRLAKFNNDPRQSESFIGLPTPANAIFWSSLPLIPISPYSSFITDLLLNNYALVIFLPLSAYLLISELPLFALKFKSFGWKGNEIRYVFLALSLILITILQFIGIPLIIILYILMSIVNNSITKKNTL